MIRHRCLPTIGVFELTMRTTLADLLEAKALKNANDFSWL